MTPSRHNVLVEAIGLLDQKQREEIEVRIYGANTYAILGR